MHVKDTGTSVTARCVPSVRMLGGLGSLADRKISVGMSVSGTLFWGPCNLGVEKSLRWTRLNSVYCTASTVELLPHP